MATDNHAARFNRRTFDPGSSSGDGATLDTLRALGRSRARRYSRHEDACKDHQSCCGSTALRNLWLPECDDSTKGELTFVDIGCGDSADAAIASRLGFKVVAMDLFAPSCQWEGVTFQQVDVADGLPLPDGSVYALVSQAMIDLVEPESRGRLYQEVFRVLEPGGSFSQFGQSLSAGHGFDHRTEVERVRSVGFRAVQLWPNGFVVVK